MLLKYSSKIPRCGSLCCGYELGSIVFHLSLINISLSCFQIGELWIKKEEVQKDVIRESSSANTQRTINMKHNSNMCHQTVKSQRCFMICLISCVNAHSLFIYKSLLIPER